MRDGMGAVINQLETTEKAHLKSGKGFRKTNCRTSSLVDGFYLCQIYKAGCEYAFSFGASYLCRSPNRIDYARN